MDVRHSLVTNKVSSHLQAPSLDEHCSKLYATIKSGLESSLGQLKVSIQGYSVCHCGELASFQILLSFSLLDPGQCWVYKQLPHPQCDSQLLL